MKIVLLCLGHENIGLEYISACLKKAGHETILIKAGMSIQAYYTLGKFINGIPHTQFYQDKLIKQLEQISPDLIGFSVYSDTYGWACKIASTIKTRWGIPVVFGGIHASSVPDIVIKESFVDYVCVGEGEAAFVELVNLLEKGEDIREVKNIWSKESGKVFENAVRPLDSHLDDIPFPDKSALYESYGRFTNVYTIITSRGCPYPCTFCYNNLLRRLYQGQGSILRMRSIDNVIAELKEAKAKYKISYVLFADDVLTLNTARMEEFSLKYREEIGLPFTCEIHPSHINKRIVELLEAAGCATAGFGLQTISENLRENVLHRKEKNQQVVETIQLFQKSEIYLYADVLFNIPGQDEAELIDTARFLNRYPPDLVLPFQLRFYPRTDIIDIGIEKGVLSSADVEKIENSKSYAPFNIKSEQNGVDKLLPWVLMSRSLPKFLVDFILDKKIYRYGFPLSYVIFHLYCLLGDIYKVGIKNKRKFRYFPLLKQLQYCVNYLQEWRRFKIKQWWIS